jgi:hypothetical protein
VIGGSKEPTAQQLQELIKVLVDELLKLWEEGIRVKTREYEQGAI